MLLRGVAWFFLHAGSYLELILVAAASKYSPMWDDAVVDAEVDARFERSASIIASGRQHSAKRSLAGVCSLDELDLCMH